MKKIIFYSFLSLFCIISSAFAESRADQVRVGQVNDPFSASEAFRDRVEFWKLIFTRYGENDRVFHCRSYPSVIYSVLNFSDLEKNMSGRSLEKAKERAVDAEINRIQTALRKLGAGMPATTAFEKRVENLFQDVPGQGTRKYREASDPKEIRYQRGVKERFSDGIRRSGRYLYAIEAIFKSEGLPTELGRIPLVESSFDYKAYSSVGAAGIWQFMRATGKKFMHITSAIDERRDPVMATRAAAKYLKHAYEELGEWPLAITSYNHGIAGIARAVEATGSRDLGVIIEKYDGPSFGFASSNFYAEFLAALEIDRNVDHYLPGVQREQPWLFDEIVLGRATYFGDLARRSGVSKATLEELNLAFRPQIIQGRAAIPAGRVVKVPRGSGAMLVKALPGSYIHPLDLGLPDPYKKEETVVVSNDSLARKRAEVSKKTETKRRYKVQKGDTLSSIASKHSVSWQKLADANSLETPRNLRAGVELVIP